MTISCLDEVFEKTDSVLIKPYQFQLAYGKQRAHKIYENGLFENGDNIWKNLPPPRTPTEKHSIIDLF